MKKFMNLLDPDEAAEIFEELKANLPQPSVEAAIGIKTDQIGDKNVTRYNPILRVCIKFSYLNVKNHKIYFYYSLK
jgi:hypothetical protein